jgi:hypothetical protein
VGCGFDFSAVMLVFNCSVWTALRRVQVGGLCPGGEERIVFFGDFNASFASATCVVGLSFSVLDAVWVYWRDDEMLGTETPTSATAGRSYSKDGLGLGTQSVYRPRGFQKFILYVHVDLFAFRWSALCRSTIMGPRRMRGDLDKRLRWRILSRLLC